MSSIKDEIDKHDPMKKHMWGKEEKIIHVMTIDSIVKAIKYPYGVLHSNGNLKEKNSFEIYEPKKKRRFITSNLHRWNG